MPSPERCRPRPRARQVLLGVALVGLILGALAPSGLAHGLLSVNIVVPPTDACPPGQARCLNGTENQPILHAGDEADLYVWNDDHEEHRVLVTTNASADPSRQDTPAEVAIADSGPVPANGSRDAGQLTIPRDAEALYVWCETGDHEAQGAWFTIPVEPAPEADEQAAETSGPGPWLVLSAALAVTVGRLRRD